MNRRPTSVIILTAVFFVIPFLNIASYYLMFAQHVSVAHYLKCLLSITDNYSALFNMTIPSWIAAGAILSMKKWSYPVFFTSIMWLSFITFYSYLTETTHASLLYEMIVPVFFNLACVTYCLMPKMRQYYYEAEHFEEEEVFPDLAFMMDDEVTEEI